MNDSELNDQFTACERTNTTLSITSPDIASEEITRTLSIEPSRTKLKGDSYKGIEITKNGWFLSSETSVDSIDACDHIDWLFTQLKNKEEKIAELKARGCHVAIGCLWVSKYGRGGPILREKQLFSLAKFRIPIGWDVWIEKK